MCQWVTVGWRCVGRGEGGEGGGCKESAGQGEREGQSNKNSTHYSADIHQVLHLWRHPTTFCLNCRFCAHQFRANRSHIAHQRVLNHAVQKPHTSLVNDL